MIYTIDEAGIHFMIEDNEADAVARMLEARTHSIGSATAPPEIPLTQAVQACRDVSAWIERLDDDVPAVEPD